MSAVLLFPLPPVRHPPLHGPDPSAVAWRPTPFRWKPPRRIDWSH